MCSIANRNYAFEIPLPEDVLLKRYQGRYYPFIQYLLELQVRSDVIILSLLE